MRRLDIEDVLGHVPAPEIHAGAHLLHVLFTLGPVRGEMPLLEENLEPWERRRGLFLQPWQAELIVDLSKSYLTEMHSAREFSALSPWPKGRQVWKYVTEKKHEIARQKDAETEAKEPPAHGRSKRHRNPPPR